jgi:hypothetical protein
LVYDFRSILNQSVNEVMKAAIYTFAILSHIHGLVALSAHYLPIVVGNKCGHVLTGH